MKAALIWAVILLILIIITQIRVGARVRYCSDGFLVRVRVGQIEKQVFPAQPKKNEKPKRKKLKKEPVSSPEPEQNSVSERIGGALDYARTLFSVILQAADTFKKKLRVDTLRLELTAGETDPADAAMLYGRAMAILGAFWHPLTESFHVKDGSAKVNLDFAASSMTLYADAVLTLKIGQVLWLILYFGIRMLRGFLTVRSQQKNHERKAA